MIRATTCTCQACASIGSLDLKFVAHAGNFVLQQLGGREDLAGPDVILVHRLLKNSIAESKGTAGYAFLTQPLLDLVGRPVSLPSHEEVYESLGTVRGGVLHLAPVVEAVRSSRRVMVEPGEADFRATLHVPAPRAVAWDWWVNPARSLQWIPGVTGWEDHPRDDGRLGTGSTMHCAHGSGSSFQRYLDWRPFDYLTAETSTVRRSLGTPPPGVTCTIFRDLPDGTTEIEFRARATIGRLQRLLMLPLIKLTIGREFRKAERKLAQLIAAEEAAGGGEVEQPVDAAAAI
jgi:hypothetical protein